MGKPRITAKSQDSWLRCLATKKMQYPSRPLPWTQYAHRHLYHGQQLAL